MAGSSEATNDAGDVIEALSRRQELLSALEGRECERPRLVEELDQSRATVYRGIKELVEFGMVEYGTDGYRLTTWGATALEAHRNYCSFVRTATDARSLLNVIPGRPALPAALFRNASVVQASGPAPAAAGNRMASLIGGADRIRALAKSHSQTDAVDVWHRAVVEGGTATEFVFAAEFYDYLSGAADPEIAAILESECVTNFTVSALPYGLFLLEAEDGDDYAVLLAYDDDALLQGIVVTSDRAALDWGERVYREYRQEATPV